MGGGAIKGRPPRRGNTSQNCVAHLHAQSKSNNKILWFPSSGPKSPFPERLTCLDIAVKASTHNSSNVLQTLNRSCVKSLKAIEFREPIVLYLHTDILCKQLTCSLPPDLCASQGHFFYIQNLLAFSWISLIAEKRWLTLWNTLHTAHLYMLFVSS